MTRFEACRESVITAENSSALQSPAQALDVTVRTAGRGVRDACGWIRLIDIYDGEIL